MTDPIRHTFNGTADAMIDAIERARTHDFPDDVRRLADVVFQCDSLKAAALSLATQIQFVAEHEGKKPRPKR